MSTPLSSYPLPSHPHNILLTLPRTASNLLTRLLSLPFQPSITSHPQDGYFFIPALQYRLTHSTFDTPCDVWPASICTGLNETLDQSLSAYQDFITLASKNRKGTYIKEHINWTTTAGAEYVVLHNHQSPNTSSTTTTTTPSPTEEEERARRTEAPPIHTIPFNPTHIPTSLFKSLRPTFLIRHPALTFPSLFRTVRDNEGAAALLSACQAQAKGLAWECTYRWHIHLYRYLLTMSTYPLPTREESVMYPIILDAADLADQELVRKYARAVGLDPDVVVFEWGVATGEERKGMGEMEGRMKDTLLGSIGVVVGKLRGKEEEERVKWREEFGEVVAGRLEALVRDAMADYEWLRERRLCV